MPRATREGTELEYAVAGDPEDPVLLLVNGLGGQLTNWDDDFVEAFVDRGFSVVRFDNRDTGLSSRTDPAVDASALLQAFLAGEPAEVPYTLGDLAADAVAVLDALDVERAHVFGLSLGGMIAQTMAIEHPGRLASLTAVMTTTGQPDVGQPRADVIGHLMRPGPVGRDEAVEHSVRYLRLIGSPDHFEEQRVRHRAATGYDRAFNPAARALQVLAVAASGDRAAGLRTLSVPTLVIHGDRDPLIDVSGGRRLAELVPGADLLELEGMGHDLPTYFWPVIVESVTKLAARAAA